MSAFLELIVSSYAWILIVVAQYSTIAYLSFKANGQNNNLLIYVYLLGILPTWTILCKYSTNLSLAGYIYDFAIAFSWTIGVVFFQGKSITVYQYIGIIFMVTGIFLFKKST